MKIKTEGKCIGCKEKYAPGKGNAHLLKCTDALQFLRSQAKLEEGYLVRISWAEINLFTDFVKIGVTVQISPPSSGASELLQ